MKAAIFDVKNNLSAYIKEVESGSTVEITKHDNPVAVLIGMEGYQKINPKKVSFLTSYKTFIEQYHYTESENEYEDIYDGIREKDKDSGNRKIEW